MMCNPGLRLRRQTLPGMEGSLPSPQADESLSLRERARAPLTTAPEMLLRKLVFLFTV